MSNALLAGIGTLVTMLALGAFSVYQLDKTEAEYHGPEFESPETTTGLTN